MDIHEARTLTADELAVSDTHVAQADANAAEATQLLDALERQAVEADQVPKAAPVVEARQLADFAVKRADRTREMAARAVAAKRLLDLHQLGTEVEAFAASKAGRTGIQDAVRKIAKAREELLKLVDDHNQKVRELRTRAQVLGAQPLPLSGILSADCAYVHLANGGLRTQSVSVARLDHLPVRYAITQAAEGNADVAIGALGPITENHGQQEETAPKPTLPGPVSPPTPRKAGPA